jgi:molybdenum cofactor synthesis domain-containing protein
MTHHTVPVPRARTCQVVTVSDRCARGVAEDRSGPRLVELLRAEGLQVSGPVVVPDGADSVAEALTAAIRDGADLVVTTGGTGAAPRDLTPEGTQRLVTRELVGVAEHLRREGTRHTPLAVLSRGVVGVIDPDDGDAGRVLVVNLPGSVGAVEQGVEALQPLLGHLLEQLRGEGDR